MFRIFIDRPVLSAVISILIIIVGSISLSNLPITLFPEIALPTVVVSANYPGANAETVSRAVATPLEEAINGVEDMIYICSQTRIMTAL
jgi:HAE1 family hydrophobic/amphiphilic exporter-1